MTKDKKKKRVVNKKGFIFINILFLVLFVSSIILSLIDRCYWHIMWGDGQSIGVLCQVVTTLNTFITSIIGITISLQNDECYGVKFKIFNNLRIDLHYSIVGIIILSILFSVLNIFFYLINWVFASLLIACISFIFCVYISVKEIPLMTKTDKGLKRVIKSRLIAEWKNPVGEYPKGLKEVLKYLMSEEYNLIETYNFFKTKDKIYNRYLIFKLLELQCDIAFSLGDIKDEYRRNKITNRLIDNIRDIIYFNFDLFEIIGKDFLEYKHLVTRVLFRTVEIECGKGRTTKMIASYLTMLKYAKFNDNKKEFAISIIIIMTSISLASNQFEFLDEISKELSKYHYGIKEKNPETLIFAIISMHMYFLCNDCKNASEKLKNDILAFINKSGVINNTKIISWKNLFNTFAYEFPLDFNEFLYFFKLNEHNWDVRIENAGAQFVIFDEEYVLRWYLANLFSSHTVSKYDYNELIKADLSIKYYLQKLRDEIYLDNEITMPAFFNKVKSFFGDETENFVWFKIMEERDKKFFNFTNSLYISTLEEKRKKALTTNVVDIISKYRNKIEKNIENEFGYNSSLMVDSEYKVLNIYAEKASDAINFDDAIIDYLTRSIFEEISSNTHKTTIYKHQQNYYEKVDNALNSNLDCVSNSAIYSVEHSLRNKEYLVKKYREKISKLNVFESKILHGTTLITKDGFSFNVQFIEFNAFDLTPEQLSQKVEQYKKEDGQYIYEGAFISREEVERFIREQYYILHMVISYKIISSEDSIFVIDLYSNEDED